MASVREVFLANYAATLFMFQYLFHKLLEYILAKAITASALSVLVKRKWDHRDITSNVIAYKHLHR